MHAKLLLFLTGEGTASGTRLSVTIPACHACSIISIICLSISNPCLLHICAQTCRIAKSYKLPNSFLCDKNWMKLRWVLAAHCGVFGPLKQKCKATALNELVNLPTWVRDNFISHTYTTCSCGGPHANFALLSATNISCDWSASCPPMTPLATLQGRT